MFIKSFTHFVIKIINSGVSRKPSSDDDPEFGYGFMPTESSLTQGISAVPHNSNGLCWLVVIQKEY